MVTTGENDNGNNVALNHNLLKPIQESLKDKVFSGWLAERTWIDKLSNYRDVIEVDEWEDDLIAQLNSLIVGIEGVDSGDCWINITGPSSSTPCYKLWILLAELVPPGHYWFMIEDVIYDRKFGLHILITPIRTVNEFDGESFEQRSRRQRTIDEIDPAEVWKEFFTNIKLENLHSLKTILLSSLSPSNIGLVFRSVAVFVMMGFALCKELCLFSLKFLNQLGILVERSTPMFESLLNFVGKIIGGVLLFLTMVYNDLRNPRPRPPPPNSQNQDRRPYGQQQPIRYIPPDMWKSQHDKL